MGPASKKKINGYLVVVGLLAVTAGFFVSPEKIEPSSLNTQTVTLARNAKYSMSQWRGSGVYELWTHEARAGFIIDVPGGIAAKWETLDSLQTGDTLTIQYDRDQASALNDPAKEIPIHRLQKGNRSYFSVAEYNAANKHYGNKLAWYAWITGALLLLNGLAILKDKTAYILTGIFITGCILLRIIGLK